MNLKDLMPNGSDLDKISVIKAFFAGVLTKWYWLVTVPAISITYKIYKKLEEKGLVDAFFEEIQKNLIVIEFIVDKCMDHILELEQLYNCIGSF